MFWFKKKEIINEKEILKERLLNELNRVWNNLNKQQVISIVNGVFR